MRLCSSVSVCLWDLRQLNEHTIEPFCFYYLNQNGHHHAQCVTQAPERAAQLSPRGPKHHQIGQYFEGYFLILTGSVLHRETAVTCSWPIVGLEMLVSLGEVLVLQICFQHL